MELEDLEEDLPSHTVKRLKNGGSSVQLNKPRVQPTEKQQTKVNGNSAAVSATEQKMGEIIYTEDSTSSGMFRKPEMPNTIHLVNSGNNVSVHQKFTNDPRTPFQKKEKPECPVRYLTRSEVGSSTRGVFRVEHSEVPAPVLQPRGQRPKRLDGTRGS